MLTTYTSIIQFLKTPHCGREEHDTVSQKLKIVLHTLIIALIIVTCISMLIAVIEHFKLVDMDKHANKELFDKFPPLVVGFLVVILAPLLEELIFRAPITLFCSYSKAFKYIFYAFALAFGYIHLFNFELTTNVVLLSPILVAPQIILGFLLGYLRIKLGLIYSILLHALFNGVLMIPILLFPDLIGV